MLSLLLWVMPRRVRRIPDTARTVVACLAAALVAAPLVAAEPAASAEATSLGVALVPQDAAFVSSSLRLREQFDAVVASNAFASIMALPAVRRALDSLEEQRATPGSPFSTIDTFLQMPENRAAGDLIADMLATDTFLYGEPSCVSFWRLVRKIAEAQQRAGVAEAADGETDVVVESIDEGDEAAMDVRGADAAGLAAARQARAIVATLAANLDLIVVPDLVWGFRTTKADLAAGQILRLEALGAWLGGGPGRVDRRTIAGVEFLVFTLDGAAVVRDLGNLTEALGELTDDAEAAARVIGRLETLDLVLAIGLVDDHVIVSLGDSADHLDKLALPKSGRRGVLTLPAFAPLLRHPTGRLTGVAYMSEALCDAVNTSRSDIESMLAVVDQLDESAGMSAAAKQDVHDLVEKAVDEWGKRLPEAGPWMAYSFLAEQGYEGYVWNWARNQPLDGSKRLDLLEHAGGAPLVMAVSRIKGDEAGFDALARLVQAAWGLVGKHAAAGMEPGEKQAFDAFGDLGSRASRVLRDKLVKALADGQIGVVVDAKGRTRKPQGDLPSSAEPLPIIEPAVVVSLADPKLFREGLSDLFELGDEFTDLVRRTAPDAVPEGYRIPEPEKAKVDEGSVWSWKLVNGRLDDQIRPAIGVGEKVAVFSMAPKQAGRVLVESRLETGAQLTKFDEPLAAAAAYDFAGLVDAVEPWVTYLTRYGCVQERDGGVDPDVELTAADENPQAKEVLEHVHVVLAALKSLRAGVTETSFQDDALVTHWRNVIRDQPAK